MTFKLSPPVFHLQKMDLNWTAIKKEEPVEYFLTSDGEFNVNSDHLGTYSDENLTGSSHIQVKQEDVNESIDANEHDYIDDDESNHPLACTDEEPETRGDPDSDYGDSDDDDNDSDCNGDNNTKKKSKTPKKPTRVSSKFQISIIDDDDDITSNAPPYTCRVCSLSFPLEKSLIVHRSIHKEKKFLCDVCQKVFRTRDCIHEHMKVHSQRVKSFECEICDMAFYDKQSLNRHMKVAHSTAQRKKFRCPNTMCDKSYSSVWSFRQHACVDGRRPQDLAKIECSYCHKRLFNKCELTRHVQRRHTVRPDSYQCELCGRPYHYRHYGTFVQHVQQKCPKRVMYDCDYCAKETSSGESVKICSKVKIVEHFYAVHGIECTSRARRCPFCAECFFTEYNFNRHLKNKHPEWTCVHCSQTFRAKSSITIHQKHCMLKKRFDKYSEQANVDGYHKNGSYSCQLCKCSFITHTNLLEHTAEVHLEKNFQVNAGDAPIRSSKCSRNDTRRFQCTICASMFSRSDHLKRHLKSHSKTRQLFYCDVCEKAYTTKYAIQKHLRRGDHRKNWECEYCSIKFQRLSSYTKHLRFCKMIDKRGEATKRES